MTRTAKTYNLPDSKDVTSNVDEHINEWHKIAQPIEHALGLKLVCYDPKFVFASTNPQRSGAELISLPLWFVKRFNQVLSESTV